MNIIARDVTKIGKIKIYNVFSFFKVVLIFIAVLLLHLIITQGLSMIASTIAVDNDVDQFLNLSYAFMPFFTTLIQFMGVIVIVFMGLMIGISTNSIKHTMFMSMGENITRLNDPKSDIYFRKYFTECLIRLSNDLGLFDYPEDNSLTDLLALNVQDWKAFRDDFVIKINNHPELKQMTLIDVMNGKMTEEQKLYLKQS